jgi:uncharacterized membrane protein
MTQLLAPLAVLANGVAAGVMLSTVIGIAPFTLVLPYDRYVQAIRFLWPRYDPFMPVTNGLTFVLDVALALGTRAQPARALFGVAAFLLAAVMIISVIKNVPINKFVTSLDPESKPPDWAERDPRTRWRDWNRIRTLMALLALAVNVASVGTLL